MDTYYRTVIYVMTGLIGLCVGSFLNVVIYRLPNQMKLSSPPSHCPLCGYTLSWYDNIPIFSYLFLRGKCRRCRAPIAIRYPIVELSHALLWLLCVYRFAPDYKLAAVCGIASTVCLCIFWIDLDCQLIFDRFQIILGVLALSLFFLDRSVSHLSRLIGCVVPTLIFLLVSLAFEKIGKVEALGGGDIKFAAVSGLFLGWQRTLFAMLIASVSGAIVLAVLKHRDNGESKPYPFAPFLTTGFLIAMFYGDTVIDFYLSLLPV